MEMGWGGGGGGNEHTVSLQIVSQMAIWAANTEYGLFTFYLFCWMKLPILG